MRLWHKELIPYLPTQQLVAQWRECCLIASLLASDDHTPNHILVNPVTDYPPEHFELYCVLVYQEMAKRKFNITDEVCKKLEMHLRAWRIYLDSEVPWDCFLKDWNVESDISELFSDWHNQRYLRQCYYNLEEKYDRGGIPEKEWMVLFANFGGV
jgi:uncharacterized protein (TIGR02328 family)